MSDWEVFEELLVVELANVLAGPAVGMFFAELGSRVVKVENPRTGGDVTRSWRTGAEDESAPAAYFSCVNWGKESIAVDLRSPAGYRVVQDLVTVADVVVASYKPGDAFRLRVDAESLLGLNPRLIYAEITAYGPSDGRVGYDAVIQAESGFTSMNGTPDSGPLKMPVALMDLMAGHQLKAGVLSALLRRERTGRGGRVSVSLIESGLATLANQAANYLMTGVVPGRIGSGHPNIVPYGSSYRCADGGYIVLAVGTDRQFSRLCACLESDDLAEDPRYATNVGRVKNRPILERTLESRMARFRSEDLLTRLRSEGVPAGPVLDVGEAIDRAPSASLVLRAASGASAVRTRAFALDSAPPGALTPPPELGADGLGVLSGLLGYGEEQIDELVRTGAVGVANKRGSP